LTPAYFVGVGVGLRGGGGLPLEFSAFSYAAVASFNFCNACPYAVKSPAF
jgi:hypothetical protein